MRRCTSWPAPCVIKILPAKKVGTNKSNQYLSLWLRAYRVKIGTASENRIEIEIDARIKSGGKQSFKMPANLKPPGGN